MKMKKKFSIVMVVLLLMTLAIPQVWGYDIEATDNISIGTIEEHRILTHYSDGTTVESTYSFNTLNLMSQYNVEGYNPLESENSILSSDSEEILTGDNVDSRVGKIKAYFDENGDENPDYFIEGTASLQSYDIAVSAAHVIWRKELQNSECQGWPLYIKFEAGRSALNEGIVAGFSEISIGMNYVNNTVYDAITDREIAYLDDDWCIIHLDQFVGGTVGFFGLSTCDTTEIGMDIYLIGYPIDVSSGLKQVKTTGTITAMGGNRVYYNAYSSDGYSGGPILNDGYLYAINTSSNYITEGEQNGSAAGTRMAAWLYDMIATEREESTMRYGGMR